MPKEQLPGKPTTRRYAEEEKAAAVRMVRTLSAELGGEHGTVKRVAEQLGYGVESVPQDRRGPRRGGPIRRRRGGHRRRPRHGLRGRSPRRGHGPAARGRDALTVSEAPGEAARLR
jgi:transposase-like protein